MPGRGCTIFFIGLALAVAGCTGEAATDTSVPDGSSTTSSTTPETSTTLPQGTTAANSDDLASLVFIGGPVLTMDRSNPLAEGVAILGGEILVAGMEHDITPYIGPKTMVIDLEGRTLMPGFVDAHTHYFTNPDEFTNDMDGVQDHILSTGTTTIGAMSVGAELLDLMYLAAADDAVRVRTNVYLSHNTVCGEPIDPWIPEVSPQPVWGERLRVGGIKLFTDGGACNVPASSYTKANGAMGDLYLDADAIDNIISFYGSAGYQVAVHALGDRAIEATLDGLEVVIGDSGNPNRHRIEHNTSVRPDMRARYDEVGAVALTFGSFPTCFMVGKDYRFQFTVPEEFQEWEWPWRDLIDQNPNTVFAWHGDFPVFTDSSPIANLAGYVTRAQTLEDGTECGPEPYHAKHAITVEEALRIMTMGSAYALDREFEVGSIEPQKLADFVVLSHDPTAIDPSQLRDISVELTVFDGEVAFCGPSMQDHCAIP
jgi:predicted amidohydrolase YtcJ